MTVSWNLIMNQEQAVRKDGLSNIKSQLIVLIHLVLANGSFVKEKEGVADINHE
jgi:hypothetical protein